MSGRLPHVVFDLDDTLYAEATYVQSALNFLGHLIEDTYGRRNAARELKRLYAKGEVQPAQTYWNEHRLPPKALVDCIAAMRGHRPDISLREGAREVLSKLHQREIQWSILTDGRSLTQRQKIAALGLNNGASGLYISEERNVKKPDTAAFSQIERDFPSASSFLYIADNPRKDFVAPNYLGWNTIMLRDNGENLHTQDALLSQSMHAKITIECLTQVFDHMDLE